MCDLDSRTHSFFDASQTQVRQVLSDPHSAYGRAAANYVRHREQRRHSVRVPCVELPHGPAVGTVLGRWPDRRIGLHRLHTHPRHSLNSETVYCFNYLVIINFNLFTSS